MLTPPTITAASRRLEEDAASLTLASELYYVPPSSIYSEVKQDAVDNIKDNNVFAEELRAR